MYPLCSNWLNLAIERVKKGKKNLGIGLSNYGNVPDFLSKIQKYVKGKFKKIKVSISPKKRLISLTSFGIFRIIFR